MSTNNKDKKPPAKKPKVQAHLGMFLGPSIITNKKTGKSYIKKVEAPTGPSLVGDQTKCPNCNRSFKTSQALGNHMNHCQLTIAKKQDLEKKRAANNVFAIGPGKVKPGREKKAAANNQPDEEEEPPEIRATVELEEDAAVDGRKGNRGSANRERYSNEFKWEQLQKLDQWKESQKGKGEADSVAGFCRVFHKNEQLKWQNLINKWHHERDKIAKSVATKKYKWLRTVVATKQRNSPYKMMEDELYKTILEDRKKKGRFLA